RRNLGGEPSVAGRPWHGDHAGKQEKGPQHHAHLLASLADDKDQDADRPEPQRPKPVNTGADAQGGQQPSDAHATIRMGMTSGALLLDPISLLTLPQMRAVYSVQPFRY